jgi:3-oxoacyl-[acyl-carrier-protein] synthase II
MLGAAGAVESVFTVLALRDRRVPPTANLVDQDPEVQLNVARDTPSDLPAGEIVALNNSFGFGGHDVALAFRSAE